MEGHGFSRATRVGKDVGFSLWGRVTSHESSRAIRTVRSRKTLRFDYRAQV